MKSLIQKLKICIDIFRSKEIRDQYNVYRGMFNEEIQTNDLIDWLRKSEHFICLGIYSDGRPWVQLDDNKPEHTKIMFEALKEHIKSMPHYIIVNNALNEKIANQALIPKE
ncbi:MAG: hypothetical protein M0R17_02060 [Candidatus Omnitrophica bacterium]|nr:hypothetical protein [Candidatus Omnitrophota bacterium]